MRRLLSQKPGSFQAILWHQSAKQQKNIGAKVDLTAYDSLISFGHVHPEKKDFLLSIFDLETKKIVSTVNLGDIFTRKIYYNKKEMQIWIPVSFQKDIKYVSNKIKILDMKNGTVEELEVGLSPVDIRFVNDVAVITCLERGIGDVSTYLIDAKKCKIIDKLMIGGDVFEFGETDVQNDKVYLITDYMVLHWSMKICG